MEQNVAVESNILGEEDSADNYPPEEREAVACAVEHAKKIIFGLNTLGMNANEPVRLQSMGGTIFRVGRIKIPRIPGLFDHEIPVFCYIMIERDTADKSIRANEQYMAVCINLQIYGYGNSPHNAHEEMVASVGKYIFDIFNTYDTEKAWDSIFQRWRSNPKSSRLWDQYNAVQLDSAKYGITHDSEYDTLSDKVKELNDRAHDKVIENLNKKIIELKGKTNTEKEELNRIILLLKKTIKKQKEKAEAEKQRAEAEKKAVEQRYKAEISTLKAEISTLKAEIEKQKTDFEVIIAEKDAALKKLELENKKQKTDFEAIIAEKDAAIKKLERQETTTNAAYDTTFTTISQTPTSANNNDIYDIALNGVLMDLDVKYVAKGESDKTEESQAALCMP